MHFIVWVQQTRFIIYLDKSILCAAVGVDIAAVVHPTHTSQRGVPLYCLFFCVLACPRVIKHWFSSILFPLVFSRLWCGSSERRWVGLGSCHFCSVPSFVPGWMVSHWYFVYTFPNFLSSEQTAVYGRTVQSAPHFRTVKTHNSFWRNIKSHKQ